MNAKTKKVLAIIVNTILWLFVVFAVCITAVVLSSTNNEHGVASIGGKSFINIKTDSMNPTIKAGDMIVVKLLIDADKTELKENDVITFYTDLDKNGTKELNTHRIAEKYEEGGYTYYRTRGDNADGDNNPETIAALDADPVATSDILGIWTEKGSALWEASCPSSRPRRAFWWLSSCPLYFSSCMSFTDLSAR